MGVVTYSDEHVSPIPPARVFKASIVDSHNLMPKILPDAIKNIEIIKGGGGAGSIKQINFAEGKLTFDTIILKWVGQAGWLTKSSWVGIKYIFR